MRTLPGLLLALALVLAGCGSDDGPGTADDRASDPATASGTPTPPAGEPALIGLVSRSAVGGEVDPLAVSLDGQAAITEFAGRFEDGRMLEALTDALAGVRLPDGQVPAGAVVGLGCDPPTHVDIEVTDAGVEVTAPPVKSDKQCLVAVTTVAVVSADPDDL